VDRGGAWEMFEWLGGRGVGGSKRNRREELEQGGWMGGAGVGGGQEGRGGLHRGMGGGRGRGEG